MRKPVFRYSDQVRHKPGYIAAEDGKILDLGSGGIKLSDTALLFRIMTNVYMLKMGFLMTWLKRSGLGMGGSIT